MRPGKNEMPNLPDVENLSFEYATDFDKVDMHIHTFYSDGIYSPDEIIRLAESVGLRAISITDHDSIDAYKELNFNRNFNNLEIIPGLEFSCHFNNKEYHILSYFFDLNSKILEEKLSQIRIDREIRAEKIIAKLSKIGIEITMEQVKNIANKAPITRPHIAMALLEKGYISNIKEAFIKYIGEWSRAYQQKAKFPFEECLELIKSIGGISILAHPANSIEETDIYKMIELGLDGIEVINPMHKPEMVSYYKKITEQYWLVATGGSDFHGNKENEFYNFGNYYISYSQLQSIKSNLIT